MDNSSPEKDEKKKSPLVKHAVLVFAALCALAVIHMPKITDTLENIRTEIQNNKNAARGKQSEAADSEPSKYAALLKQRLKEDGKKVNYKRARRELLEIAYTLKGALPYSAYMAILKNTDNFRDFDKVVSCFFRLSGEGGIIDLNNFPEWKKILKYAGQFIKTEEDSETVKDSNKQTFAVF
ncbi:MAG: hypothetical protein LBR69_07845 [Endomicrobium sp.]|jgi:hypothetical protein|nr:hypothetical protein [Endomicrobium sp.]